jgi:DNA (cytosine-5)-methyltransferase 1
MAGTSPPPISAIDLFCGAGGLTHGFIEEGIKVRVGFDIDAKCKFPYEFNNKGATFVEANVEDLNCNELADHYKDGEVRVLAGCAPCQPFSSMRRAYEKSKREEIKSGTFEDKKWSLLNAFARIVSELDPDIVTMENVPQLCRHSIYDSFVSSLKSKGYYVSSKVVDCSKYGIPQRRRRLVLFASKYGDISFPEASKFAHIDNSVRSAIGELPSIPAGACCSHDPLHKSRNLTEINLKRLRASTPGGTWKEWSTDLLPNCYKKPSGGTFKSVYGRMTWDAPSPVITTQFHNLGTGRFGHPEQERALSLREGAILQTFPIDYSFVREGEPIQFTPVAQMIGNAVPPTLARIIARTIVDHAHEYHVKK